MNKLEFLTRLRNCLESGGMNSDDINDALTYYEEVFLDAGFGKEEETAASMGSPEDVAVNILRESGIHVGGAPVFAPQPIPAPSAGPMPGPMPQYQQAAPVRKKSGGHWGLKIFIAIMTFPIWLPILIVLVSVLFSLIVAALSVVFAFIVTGVALIAGGIAAIFEVPSIGLMLLGIGLIMTGFVILCCRPVFRRVIPALGKGIKGAFNWISGLFKKGGKVNE